MKVFLISGGVEVPPELRGKLVEIDDRELSRDDEHLKGTVDGRPVFVSREWLRDPDLPLPPLSVSVEPADDPEPRWLEWARAAFWVIVGFVLGAIAFRLGWLP